MLIFWFAVAVAMLDFVCAAAVWYGSGGVGLSCIDLLLRPQQAKNDCICFFKPLAHNALSFEPEGFEHFDGPRIIAFRPHRDPPNTLKAVADDFAEILHGPRTAYGNRQLDVSTGPVIVQNDGPDTFAVAFNQETNERLRDVDLEPIQDVLAGCFIVLPNQLFAHERLD
jgi:hypothetical protein